MSERDKWLAGQLRWLRSLDNVESASLLYWQRHWAYVLVAMTDPPEIEGDDGDDEAEYIIAPTMTIALELPDELRDV